jgi:transposase
MPAPYSQDLRWRAIFLTEILDLELEQVSFYLQISQSTIKRYVRKFREIGNVNTAIIGRPYNCISMHPHEELVIMEMVQQYPENTIAEILDKVYEETCRIAICMLNSALLFEEEWHNSKEGW